MLDVIPTATQHNYFWLGRNIFRINRNLMAGSWSQILDMTLDYEMYWLITNILSCTVDGDPLFA